MNIISLQNVEKTYGTRVLFKETSLTFTDTSKIGLIGVNGSGKSTFLKILANLVEPDKGNIERNGKATVYYMPQEPAFHENESILSNVFLSHHPLLALVKKYEKLSVTGRQDSAFMRVLEEMENAGGWQVEQQAKTILRKLGFSDIHDSVNVLSGGQKRRLALAQALLYPCDLLLLDEPTNHLDENAVEWLEKFLIERKGGYIISTHDRYFLNAVCKGIVELSGRRFYQYEGNYEYFLEKKALREEMEAASEEKRRQFLKREIDWVRRGAKARTTKQKARLQRYEMLVSMEKTKKAGTMDPFSLMSRLGKTIFDIENLCFSYNEKAIIKNFTYSVVRHDRIGIVGPNGIGKSTLMKLLEGTLAPDEGTVGRGETVRIAHFTQHLPDFNESMRVLDYIREDRSHLFLNDGSSLSAGQLLERFLFPAELHGVPIARISGGERRRLFLLKLLMSAPNVLLLDEPTNDLDIPTLEVLEEFLDQFSGLVITVCHDRFFLDRVVDKLFVFQGSGKIEIFHGSYSEYRDLWTNESKSQNPDKGVLKEKTKEYGHKPQPLIKGDRKGLTDKEEKEYEIIMEELPRLEMLLKGLNLQLSTAESDYEQMKKMLEQIEGVQSEIDAMTERWMCLEEKKG